MLTKKLTVNNIDILNLINNHFYDFYQKIYMICQNLINKINDIPENLFDLSENLYDLKITVTDL
jgi:hypothetical protein